ncbi:MAG: [FeFe] hydrogenase H-cluster radical SAM maturase HydE, partial [Bacteroidaceae bacterium]|nr:[FeFe] hydrogenase H-cluster radical SAM maturase HydE [Bacteroidaceae bacterium]
MDKEYLRNILDRVVGGAPLSRDNWRRLLSEGTAPDVADLLRSEASRIATENFGKGVFVRGLIEISSYCRNNCNYCGLRCSNREALRYRLTKEEILDCCREGAALGFNTFVLQGGEDVKQNDAWIVDVVRSIKKMFPDKAVTLSVGERSTEGYRAMRAAGADRYLLRHETRSDEHYALLHPATMSAAKRRA